MVIDASTIFFACIRLSFVFSLLLKTLRHLPILTLETALPEVFRLVFPQSLMA